MELFPDGAFVRLRSAVHGTYLHADEDGWRVSLNPLRASLNAAWRVHRIVRNDITFVLLHSAAYGRYLSATLDRAPRGHIGYRVLQGIYDDLQQNDVVWSAARVAAGDNQVLLQHVSRNRLLRANGRHCKWRTAVSVDDDFNRTTMMHWVVESIPLLPAPPAVLPTMDDVNPGGGFFGCRPWCMNQFHCHSEAARYTGDYYYKFMICARAGRYGRLTPLVTERPGSWENMVAVTLTAISPADLQLLFPNVDAP